MNPQDEYNLGRELIHNSLVEPNYKAGFELYLSAANKGCADAQCEVASYYANGLGYVEKNITNALYFWRLAANNGHSASQYTLGYCYLFGKWVNKNVYMARYYLNMSAKQGDAYAIAYLRSIKI